LAETLLEEDVGFLAIDEDLEADVVSIQKV
jgi:hypothetical protein